MAKILKLIYVLQSKQMRVFLSQVKRTEAFFIPLLLWKLWQKRKKCFQTSAKKPERLKKNHPPTSCFPWQETGHCMMHRATDDVVRPVVVPALLLLPPPPFCLLQTHSFLGLLFPPPFSLSFPFFSDWGHRLECPQFTGHISTARKTNIEEFSILTFPTWSSRACRTCRRGCCSGQIRTVRFKSYLGAAGAFYHWRGDGLAFARLNDPAGSEKDLGAGLFLKREGKRKSTVLLAVVCPITLSCVHQLPKSIENNNLLLLCSTIGHRLE